MKGTDMTTELVCSRVLWREPTCLLLTVSSLDLKLNKAKVASLYVNETPRPYLQISRTVVLKLKVGDHIKVVSSGIDKFIHNNYYSGFTGTFLF